MEDEGGPQVDDWTRFARQSEPQTTPKSSTFRPTTSSRHDTRKPANNHHKPKLKSTITTSQSPLPLDYRKAGSDRTLRAARGSRKVFRFVATRRRLESVQSNPASQRWREVKMPWKYQRSGSRYQSKVTNCHTLFDIPVGIQADQRGPNMPKPTRRTHHAFCWTLRRNPSSLEPPPISSSMSFHAETRQDASVYLGLLLQQSCPEHDPFFSHT